MEAAPASTTNLWRGRHCTTARCGTLWMALRLQSVLIVECPIGKATPSAIASTEAACFRKHGRRPITASKRFGPREKPARLSRHPSIVEKIDRRRVARENVRFLLCHRIGPLADGFSNSANPIIRTVSRVKFSFAILSGVSRQSRTVVFHFGPSTFLTSFAALLRATAAAQY
jgi:hypothetical protein